MSGLDFTMLAGSYLSHEEADLLSLFFAGSSVLAAAGLVLSFFRRCRRGALTLAVVGVVAVSMLLWLAGEATVQEALRVNAIFLLHWELRGQAYVTKIPLILGAITVGRVYYLYRKEKKRRRRREVNEGYTTKPREL